MTLRAGGIKVSPPLAQLDLARGSPSDRGLTDLLAGLTDERINIAFFTHCGTGAPREASICVAQPDWSRAHNVVRTLGLEPRLSVINPVVAVSIYPHGANVTLLGALLQTLTTGQIPLLGLATSLSALTITLGASYLAPALAALDDLLELPLNHAPLRWELLVKQE